MNTVELPKQEFPTWDQFVKTQSDPVLTQNSQWPGEYFIVAVKNDAGRIMGGARVDIKNLWLGKKMWWIRSITNYPACRRLERQRLAGRQLPITNEIFKYIQMEAIKRNVVFVRIQSQQWSNETMENITPRFLHHIADPEHTLAVNLSRPEAELFDSMHHKTRYNIRLAEKAGITVQPGTIDDFFNLYQATNQRKGIRGYSKEYVEKLAKLNDPVVANIMIAKQGSELLGANFLIGFGATMFYVFGGSSDTKRELMAPHLLHWESIRRAKQLGYLWYDMGGISDTNPDWSGITRFKRSFVSKQTGKEINAGKTRDLVISQWWYYVFAAIKRAFDLTNPKYE